MYSDKFKGHRDESCIFKFRVPCLSLNFLTPINKLIF